MNERIAGAQGDAFTPAREPFDVTTFLRPVWKRRWAVALIFVMTVTVAAVKSFGTAPVYRATCQVLIDREDPNILNVKEVLAIDATDTDYYLTQYELLKSRSLAKRVVETLDLASNQTLNPPPRDSLMQRLGLSEQIAKVRSWLKKPAPKSPESESDELQQIVNRYLDALDVEPLRNSRLVDISFECGDPSLAALIANEHARLYIETTLERKFTASQDAAEWLKERIYAIQDKLETSERRLQEYRRKNDLVSVDLEERHDIIVQKLGDLSQELTHSRTEAIEKSNLYGEFMNARSDPQALESLPVIVNNPLIQQLKSEKVKLEARKSEMAQKFGPAHPKMISLASELNELKKKIDAEIYKIGESIELEHRMALAKEKSLLAELEAQKRDAFKLNQREIHYNILKREAETDKTMYENLLKRAKETSLAEGLRASNIAVVDPAVIPRTPVRPRRALNVCVAAVAGLSLGFGLALLLEYLDNSVKDTQDVEHYLNAPVLGTVTHFRKAEANKDGSRVDGELVTASHPRSPVSETFRNIRTNILFSMLGARGQALLITSAGMLEGKTVVTCNLAISLAQLQKRVLLIDSDLRKPRIHKIFGIKDSPGFSNILVGQASIEKCARQTEGENLSIIPSGPIPPNPSELLSSEAMERFLADAKQRYDFVLFDSPPVLLVTDPVVLSKKVDGAAVVVRTGKTPRQSLRRTVSDLEEIGARVIGIVLNNVEQQTSAYYPAYYKYAKYGYYSHSEDKEKLQVSQTGQ